MQLQYYAQAKARLDSSIKTVSTFSEMEELFGSEDFCSFVKASWKMSDSEDPRLKKMKVTIRCIPFNQTGKEAPCILTGETTTQEAIFAKAY